MGYRNSGSRNRRWIALCVLYSLLLVLSIVLFLIPIPANEAQFGATLLVWIAVSIAVVCVRTSDSSYSRAAAGSVLVSSAIGTAVICAVILPKSGLMEFTPCCIALIVLISSLLIVAVSECAQKGLREVKRGKSRFPVISMVGVGILCCGIYVAIICLRYSEGQSCWLPSALMLMVVCSVFGLAWLYTSRVISSNTSFFSRVCLSGKPKWDIPDNCKNVPHGFFLRALVDSSQYIPRIKESIRPDHGAYHLRTEYEFSIPSCYIHSSKDSSVVIPVLWQHKKELTNELKFEETSGTYVCRMNDSETFKYLNGCLQKWLKFHCKMSLEDSNQLSERISTGMWADPDSYDWSGVINDIKGMPYEGFVLELIRQSHYVKPVCACVEKDAIKSGRVTIVALRDVPLVPVVHLKENGKLSFGGRLRRFLTKHRMRYYFNLGNADRCTNYHLTFTGPSGTYLSDSSLKCVDGKIDFCIAGTMRMNHRYDQENTRLYIKHGCGFSRVALMLVYEERSHRSLQALCAAATVSLVLFVYLGFRFVFGPAQNPVGVGDIALPLTALTLTSLLSLWEAMERQRAEEWLWILASGVFALSLFMVLWFAFESASSTDNNPFMPSAELRIAWFVSLGAIFSATLASFVALFMQIRQHGALMDRVPYTRCAQEDCFEKNLELDSLLPNASLSNASGTKCASSPSIPVNSKYSGLDVYFPIIGKDWGDGWLVPVWSAYANPYNAGTVRFFNQAKDHCG